jgi:hypothetical protein
LLPEVLEEALSLVLLSSHDCVVFPQFGTAEVSVGALDPAGQDESGIFLSLWFVKPQQCGALSPTLT